MAAYITNDLLFEDLKEQDEYAFKILFLRYYDKLSRKCYSIVNRWEIAEEIAVDVLHTLWKKANEITITTGIEQYLYRAAHNASLNYLRDASRREPVITYVPDFPSELGAYDDSYEAVYDNNKGSIYETFESLVSMLPEENQQIIHLKKQGLTYKAIADALQLPEKKVRNIMERTVKKLKLQYKQEHLSGIGNLLLLSILHNLNEIIVFLICFSYILQ